MPFVEGIELLVIGHDQMSVARHLQRAAVDSLFGQRIHLGEKNTRIDHHAVADHGRDVVVQHATRHQLKGKRLAVYNQGVARVVAPLIADNQFHFLGYEVGELALTFVTPLGADHDRCRHETLLKGHPERSNRSGLRANSLCIDHSAKRLVGEA